MTWSISENLFVPEITASDMIHYLLIIFMAIELTANFIALLFFICRKQAMKTGNAVSHESRSVIDKQISVSFRCLRQYCKCLHKRVLPACANNNDWSDCIWQDVWPRAEAVKTSLPWLFIIVCCQASSSGRTGQIAFYNDCLCDSDRKRKLLTMLSC